MHRILTVLGWSPGIRTMVASHLLQCGCLVGVYETWRQETVTIVDACSASCSNQAHGEHITLARTPPDSTGNTDATRIVTAHRVRRAGFALSVHGSPDDQSTQ